MKLLFPFRKDKNVKNFYNNLEFVKNSNVKATFLALQIENSEKYNQQFFKDLTNELSSRGVFYKKLHAINKTSLFPKKYNNKKEIYKSFLFNEKQEKGLKDSIVFLEKRDFLVSKIKYEGYFFKSKPHKNNTDSYNKEWKMNYIIAKNTKN